MATGASGLILIALASCDGARHATTSGADFGLDVRPANPTCLAPPRPPPSVPVTFERLYGNVELVDPAGKGQTPGDRARW